MFYRITGLCGQACNSFGLLFPMKLRLLAYIMFLFVDHDCAEGYVCNVLGV